MNTTTGSLTEAKVWQEATVSSIVMIGCTKHCLMKAHGVMLISQNEPLTA